ncbi:ribonuclease P protein component 1 [Salarchaeum sp. III]|uniref:ribonuclease P protein component 1 n=1 Tax=Salarchaeum sp. III TaxID=3107927 RepID=UPI002ED88F2E
MLTPENLPRHELVGLHVEVVDSTDPSRVGIAGRIVDETMRTLLVEPRSTQRASADRPEARAEGESEGSSGVKRVPKVGTTLEVRLTDEPAAAPKAAGTASKPASGDPDSETQTTGDGAAYVTVDGVVLLSRPAMRTEKGVNSQWR